MEGEQKSLKKMVTRPRVELDFEIGESKNVLGYEGNVKFAGVSEELGAFELKLTMAPKLMSIQLEEPMLILN